MSENLTNNVTVNNAQKEEENNMKKDFATICERLDKEDKMRDIIFIHKEAGTKKDAVRVSSAADIPDFLKEAIVVTDSGVTLQCVEGTETANFGEVIGYEKSENTSSGYNCWVIGNAADSLIEKDGVFYKKALIYKAMLIDEDALPSFLFGANVWKNDDGSWSIKTDWGESKGFPDEAYWVLYGKKDDETPDANILTKTEKSFNDYIVCDENGVDLGRLFDLDAEWNSKNE